MVRRARGGCRPPVAAQHQDAVPWNVKVALYVFTLPGMVGPSWVGRTIRGAAAPATLAASRPCARVIDGMLAMIAARHAPAFRTVSRSAALATRRLGHELAGVGVAAMALGGLFGRFVVPGVVGQQRDTGAFYYPLTAWLAQELASGRFPLWCPLIFAGYPLVADGEIGLLYPPNLVALLLLPVDVAFVLMRAAHYLLAAAGTYAFCRVLGVGRAGSVFGGLSFALGGFMLGHLDHGNILRSAAWLPLILAAADLALRALGRRRWLWLALGAAALTMSGLGLHPQILLINLVALGLWVCARTVVLATWKRPWRDTPRALLVGLRRGGVVATGISVIGLAGAAAQLLPTYELGLASSRGGGLSYAQAAAGGVAPVDLLTLLLPYGFRTDPAAQWMRYPYWESTIFVGVGGLLLAGTGLALGQRSVAIPVALVGLIGLGLAMADHAPLNLYAWLWSLPGFSSMRAPVRYAVMFELMLAVLAAVGLDCLRRAPAGRGASAVAAVLAIIVGLLIGAGWMLRAWLLADERAALAAIEHAYLSLPRDRPALSPATVRAGLLATLAPNNPWTGLALASGVATAVALVSWAGTGRGSMRLVGVTAAIGAAELLAVAHGFHPTVSRGQLGEESRQMRFLSQQPGEWRTLLAGRSDLSITSRPALSGVAQAYGYSSLPTARAERYWTRVHEVDDDLLDLWSIRYVVEPKGGSARSQVRGVLVDPARPLIDGVAQSPLGDETFRIAPTRGDALRIVGGLNAASHIADGEVVATIRVHAPGEAPSTLAVRAGEHLAEAAYDEATTTPAHRKALVGQRWEPRDPAGRVYRRDLYVADLALPVSALIERIEVRAVLPAGALRLAGLGIVDATADSVRSVLPIHRTKYTLALETEAALILENHAARPRAYLAEAAVVVPADDWSLVRITDQPLDLASTVMIEEGDGAADITAPAVVPRPALGANEGADVVASEPDRVVVRVRANADRYLILADSYFPGWHATVDGEPVPIHRANYLFRAVRVPGGDHTVTWEYRPASLYVGASISLVAVIVLGLLVHRSLDRNEPGPPTAAPIRRPDLGARGGRRRAGRGGAACSGGVGASSPRPSPSSPS